MANLTPGRRRRCSRSTYRSCSLACALSGCRCYSLLASSVSCCWPLCAAETLGNLHIGHRRQQSPISYIRSDVSAFAETRTRLSAAADHLDCGSPWIHLSRHRGSHVTTESHIQAKSWIGSRNWQSTLTALAANLLSQHFSTRSLRSADSCNDASLPLFIG